MDDTQPQTTKPISDDQELAKVLAGVSQESNNLDFEETPVAPTVTNVAPTVVAPTVTNTDSNSDEKPASEVPQTTVAGNNFPNITQPNAESGDLESIKKDALVELRPLVEKLNLEPEEKFDTYLLLLRSTDDKTIIQPAHMAARNIADETRRAQALLDIIKEIDYLSTPTQPTI